MLRKNLRRVDSSAEEAAVPTDSRRRSGRPRDASVDVRVLRETFDLLAEKGFRGLRIDEVARRAGVPKSMPSMRPWAHAWMSRGRTR